MLRLGDACRAARDSTPVVPAGKTAFVLAGGGAKGAFEAGAVSYLVEEEGIVPQVITATSAGAICAAVLAQARTHTEMVARARELHDDLLAMTRSELLFGKQPWVAALEGTLFGRAIDHWVVERMRPPVPGADRGDPAPVPQRSWLRLAAQVAKALPSLGRAGRRIRGRTGSVLTLDPLATGLRKGSGGITPVDPALVRRPGLDLRLAVVALGAGVLRYVRGDGVLVAEDALTPVPDPAGGPVDLVDGVVASASVPMVFPPRAMAGDAYVDGGVVDNVPVSAAARLGATRIFAILAVPVDPGADGLDYANASAADVFLRAIGSISFAERQRANLAPALPAGTEVTVIDPLVDVVGPFEVSQGLMLLNMDYGWMRAADVLADVDATTRRIAVEATDAVAVARTQAWHREEELYASGRLANGDLAALVRSKRAVRDALAERKGLGLATPPDADRWWSGYEVHAAPPPAGLPPDLLSD